MQVRKLVVQELTHDGWFPRFRCTQHHNPERPLTFRRIYRIDYTIGKMISELNAKSARIKRNLSTWWDIRRICGSKTFAHGIENGFSSKDWSSPFERHLFVFRALFDWGEASNKRLFSEACEHRPSRPLSQNDEKVVHELHFFPLQLRVFT